MLAISTLDQNQLLFAIELGHDAYKYIIFKTVWIDETRIDSRFI